MEVAHTDLEDALVVILVILLFITILVFIRIIVAIATVLVILFIVAILFVTAIPFVIIIILLFAATLFAVFIVTILPSIYMSFATDILFVTDNLIFTIPDQLLDCRPEAIRSVYHPVTGRRYVDALGCQHGCSQPKPSLTALARFTPAHATHREG